MARQGEAQACSQRLLSQLERVFELSDLAATICSHLHTWVDSHNLKALRLVSKACKAGVDASVVAFLTTVREGRAVCEQLNVAHQRWPNLRTLHVRKTALTPEIAAAVVAQPWPQLQELWIAPQGVAAAAAGPAEEGEGDGGDQGQDGSWGSRAGAELAASVAASGRELDPGAVAIMARAHWPALKL
jgi:hypothetical protein